MPAKYPIEIVGSLYRSVSRVVVGARTAADCEVDADAHLSEVIRGYRNIDADLWRADGIRRIGAVNHLVGQAEVRGVDCGWREHIGVADDSRLALIQRPGA